MIKKGDFGYKLTPNNNTWSIFVETDNYRNSAMRLYESVGFQVNREGLVYRKDYNDTAI
jgi:ribosomal protein S18 acetylase RimI-like enzyme